MCVFDKIWLKGIGWIGVLHVVLDFFIWSHVKKNCKTFLTICTYCAQIGKYFAFSQAIHDTMHLKTSYFFPKCCAMRRGVSKYVTQVVSLHLQGADDVACLNEMSISTRRVSFLGLASSAKSGRKKTCWSKKNAISNFIFCMNIKICMRSSLMVPVLGMYHEWMLVTVVIR